MTPMAIHKLQRHVYSSVTKEMTCIKNYRRNVQSMRTVPITKTPINFMVLEVNYIYFVIP